MDISFCFLFFFFHSQFRFIIFSLHSSLSIRIIHLCQYLIINFVIYHNQNIFQLIQSHLIKAKKKRTLVRNLLEKLIFFPISIFFFFKFFLNLIRQLQLCVLQDNLQSINRVFILPSIIFFILTSNK